MKTKTINTYQFDELSDKAKEKAREWYRRIDTEYSWNGEAQNTLDAFANLFPIKIKDWSYGDYRHNVTFEITDENAESVKGMRLHTWLANNVYPKLLKGKYYSKAVGVDYKSRHGTAIMEISCPLTGYCLDMDILEPVLDFLKNPKADMTLKELLDDCFHAWYTAIERDIEYQNEDEQIDENIKANEYTFTEDGKRSIIL